MSAGMAGVLVEHELTAAWLSVDAPSGFKCRCGVQHFGANPELEPRAAYAAHVAEELTKAGYGNVQEAPRAVHYAGNVRQAGYTGSPDGWSTEAWHESAYGDTGEGYSLPGRLYVIQCAWCEAVFLANGKKEAMVLYRAHEDEMQTPDPLAAALIDPEGHALVQAIHDRKAGQ